jgi:hypothetical protein
MRDNTAGRWCQRGVREMPILPCFESLEFQAANGVGTHPKCRQRHCDGETSHEPEVGNLKPSGSLASLIQIARAVERGP